MASTPKIMVGKPSLKQLLKIKPNLSANIL